MSTLHSTYHECVCVLPLFYRETQQASPASPGIYRRYFRLEGQVSRRLYLRQNLACDPYSDYQSPISQDGYYDWLV